MITRNGSVLDRPFAEVAKAIGLTKRITPRGMRRSFQDLARLAQVADVVTRSISGHATETMQRHYSTVSPKERRRASPALSVDFGSQAPGRPTLRRRTA